jgi:ribosome-associated heat shock protein Hsp15
MKKEAPKTLRIDKWLWAMRLFKTRTIASDICKRGKVIVNNTPAKSSREVKVGDTVVIDYKTYKKTVKILQLSENRLSAKLVSEYYEDLTLPEEYERRKKIEKLKLYYLDEKPSKKNRRDFERFLEEEFGFDEIDTD